MDMGFRAHKPITPAKLSRALAACGLHGPPAPAKDDPPPADPTDPGTKEHGPVAGPALIYVVADQPRVAELISGAMARCEYRTETFLSATQALAAFGAASSKPRILITDFSMPEMDGLELMRRCRQESPQPKVSLISGTRNWACT
ncbi:MAG: response regulator [Verrucomicrobia bacterium]|nr:response regulator [Verrucomicrobiota bacterium]